MNLICKNISCNIKTKNGKFYCCSNCKYVHTKLLQNCSPIRLKPFNHMIKPCKKITIMLYTRDLKSINDLEKYNNKYLRSRLNIIHKALLLCVQTDRTLKALSFFNLPSVKKFMINNKPKYEPTPHTVKYINRFSNNINVFENRRI